MLTPKFQPLRAVVYEEKTEMEAKGKVTTMLTLPRNSVFENGVCHSLDSLNFVYTYASPLN